MQGVTPKGGILLGKDIDLAGGAHRGLSPQFRENPVDRVPAPASALESHGWATCPTGGTEHGSDTAGRNLLQPLEAQGARPSGQPCTVCHSRRRQLDEERMKSRSIREPGTSPS